MKRGSRRGGWRDRRRRAAGWIGASLVWVLGGTGDVAGNEADEVFAAALQYERTLRQPGVHPPLEELRGAMAGYEAVARLFPDSAFTDHALWQSAGLAIEAYDLYREDQDLSRGSRLLRLLEMHHPTSAFAGRVAERQSQLHALTGVARLEAVERERMPDGVRVTLAIDREVGFDRVQLDDPPRLFFDLRGTEATAGLRNATLPFGEDGDVIREIRVGRHPNTVTRVVLDTQDTESCHTFTLYDPFRVVVNCGRRLAPPVVLAPDPEPESATRAERTSPDRDAPAVNDGVDAPYENSDGAFSLARQLGLGISRIVIDPGHGGHDPGARARGLQEADLVLDIALRLEQRLQATQPELEVVLTRRDDRYLPPEARATLANRVGADLFVSIHANASEHDAVRGVETYFLDFTTDPSAEALAARENAGGLATMKHLDEMLQAIAVDSKRDESRDLAETIQAAMLRKLRRIDPAVPDLGVKQAPFIVLIGAQMPSILTEISFLTNEHDARLLATDTYRALVADSLFEGILRYRRSLGADTVATRVRDAL